jgi:hypothetical protein
MTFSIQKGDRFWKSTPQYKKIVIEYMGEHIVSKIHYLHFVTIKVVRNPVITSSTKWYEGLEYNIRKETLLNVWNRVPGKSEAFKTIYDILNGE